MSDVFTSTYNLVKKVCLDRRAVRKFLNKDIPDGVLEDILVTTQVFDSLSWSSNRAPPPLRIPNPTRSWLFVTKRTKPNWLMMWWMETSMLWIVLLQRFCSWLILVWEPSPSVIIEPYKTADEYAQLQRATGHSEKGIQSHLNACMSIVLECDRIVKWQCITTPVLGPMFNWLYNGVGLFKKVVRRPTGIVWASSLWWWK